MHQFYPCGHGEPYTSSVWAELWLFVTIFSVTEEH